MPPSLRWPAVSSGSRSSPPVPSGKAEELWTHLGLEGRAEKSRIQGLERPKWPGCRSENPPDFSRSYHSKNLTVKHLNVSSCALTGPGQRGIITRSLFTQFQRA